MFRSISGLTLNAEPCEFLGLEPVSLVNTWNIDMMLVGLICV